jgi:hypothetical protein
LLHLTRREEEGAKEGVKEVGERADRRDGGMGGREGGKGELGVEKGGGKSLETTTP